MRKIIYLLSIVLLLLTSCSSYFNSGHDPDGDNDSKGITHFPLIRHPTGHKVFIFDPRYHSWAVYNEQGKRINVGKASGGASYCADINRQCRTVVGTFRVFSKGDAGCISGRFPVETNGGAPMPYCMHFHHKGYAIHGSYNVPNRNVSHGCIRVTPLVAKWLNTDFMQIGSTVIVLPY